MRSDQLDDSWHERGDHDQNQENDGGDDEAALRHAPLILIWDNQADIAYSILLSRSTRADHYRRALLFRGALFWPGYCSFQHRFISPSYAESID